jgi:hypothetical protein
MAFILTALARGVQAHFTAQLLENAPASLVRSIAAIPDHLGALLAASAISMVLAVVGFAALVIPGFIVLTRFSFVVEAVMLEDADTFTALSRSSDLAKGRAWSILPLVLIEIAIAGLTSLVALLIPGAITPVTILALDVLTAFVVMLVSTMLIVRYLDLVALSAKSS